METLQKTLQEEGIGDEDTEQSVRQRMKEAGNMHIPRCIFRFAIDFCIKT